jgi:hypothetical protein
VRQDALMFVSVIHLQLGAAKRMIRCRHASVAEVWTMQDKCSLMFLAFAAVHVLLQHNFM